MGEAHFSVMLRSEACYVDFCSRRRCEERAVMKFPQNTGLLVEFVFLKLQGCTSLQLHLKFMPYFLPR